jgi:hypothetical protein
LAGCIDFAPRDGEMADLVIVDRVAEFDGAACAAKKRSSATDAEVKRHRGLPAKSKESPMANKPNSPHEWLLEKAQHWNTDALYRALSCLAYRVDGSSIHDLFQSEMDADSEQRLNTGPSDAESWGSHRWHT